MTELEHRLYLALGTLVNDPEYIDENNHLVRLFTEDQYNMAIDLLRECYAKQFRNKND